MTSTPNGVFFGSILLDSTRLDEVREIVRPEDFYADANQRLFSHFLQMRNDGASSIDVTLLLDRLRISGEVEAIGDTAYLAEVANSVPYAANAVHYAKIVKGHADRRRVIHAATEILRDAYNGVAPAVLRAAYRSRYGAD